MARTWAKLPAGLVTEYEMSQYYQKMGVHSHQHKTGALKPNQCKNDRQGEVSRERKGS